MTDNILPHELPHALERGQASVRVLSLDCFDTLLWRDSYAPCDLFAGLAHVTTDQSVVAEANGRIAARHLHRRGEVTINAIYAHATANGAHRARTVAIAAELEAQARTLFAFAPTVELMRRAKAQGARVIILSNTYLSADQLRDLIAAAAGDEVAGLMDRIFVSSEASLSKSQVLPAKVIKKMKCKPSEILHIGDNKVADCDGARAVGVLALHLLQLDAQLERQCRFKRNCQQIITNASPAQTRDGAGGSARGQMPQRAVLAQHTPQISDPATRLCLNVLRPVFRGYDAWLREKAAQIAARCKGQVHWLFMMRDGHLPLIVHQAAGSAPSTACVEISRFVAIGASLTSCEAYVKQVALEADLNPPTLVRQMLLNEDEIAAVVGDPFGEAETAEACQRLHAELWLPKRRRTTRARAAQRAERLVAHVRAVANPPIICREEGTARGWRGEGSARGWREAGISVLKRLLFLPHGEALAALKSFEHDANLGSERMVGLFDPKHAHEGMRRRGLFYMQWSSRIFLPAQIEAEDMNTRLSLMVQKRFALGFSFADSMAHDIAIPVVYLGVQDASRTLIEAKRTHDGYCFARLPVTPETCGIALNFGLVFDRFELVSATLSPISALKGTRQNDAPPRTVMMQLEGVTDHTAGLMEWTDPGATALVIPPDLAEMTEPQMIEVVMRPFRQCPQSDLSPYQPEAHMPAWFARNFAQSQSAPAKDAAA